MNHRTLLALLAAMALLPACKDEEHCPERPQCEGGSLNALDSTCWQHPRAEGEFLWQEAVDYCDGLVLAEHDDWRLPRHNEYKLLLEDCGTTCPPCEENERCNALFCPDTSGSYWATCPGYEPGCVFSLHDGIGIEPGGYAEESEFRVRCVR